VTEKHESMTESIETVLNNRQNACARRAVPALPPYGSCVSSYRPYAR
jgi:hypothetical protein